MLEIFVFIVKFIFGVILFFAIYELIREIKRKRNLEKYKQIKNQGKKETRKENKNTPNEILNKDKKITEEVTKKSEQSRRKQQNFKKKAEIKTTKGKTLAEIKGAEGEMKIASILKSTPGNGKILLNTYIPKINNHKEFTEIDIIYINSSGIYVIESKNYSGVIVGGDGYSQWEQRLRGNNNKYRFYNPVRQNEGHIKHLQNLLYNVNKDAFHSLIVFSDHCKLEVHSYADVINRRELKEFIFSKLKSQPNVLTTENIDDIYIKLLPYTQVSDEFKEQHIKNIEKNKNKDKRKIGFRIN